MEPAILADALAEVAAAAGEIAEIEGRTGRTGPNVVA